MNINARIITTPLLPPDFVDSVVESFATRIGEKTEGARVVERIPNAYSSAHPSEVVMCALPSGATLSLHLKYDGNQSVDGLGYRGVSYESEVFRTVLSDLPVSVPSFYAAGVDAEIAGSWLLIEHVHGVTVRRLAVSEGMQPAATWIGRFHNLTQVKLRDHGFDSVIRHDLDYYTAWSKRVADVFSGGDGWLGHALRVYESQVGALTDRPQAILHGDFFTSNVLVSDGTVFPVDWESAAVGAGEIDLAALLVVGWGTDAVEVCQNAYTAARSIPLDNSFYRAYELARLYVAFRWLALKGHHPGSGWFLNIVRDAASSLEEC